MQMNVYVYMLGSINIQNLAESKENILKDSESFFASFNFLDQCFIDNILNLYKKNSQYYCIIIVVIIVVKILLSMPCILCQGHHEAGQGHYTRT